MNSIFDFQIGNNNYQITLTKHAKDRMNERNITEDHIIDNVLSLSTNQVKNLNNNASEAIIIDKESGVSVVVGFNKRGRITVITVINKSNVYVKENTVSIKI